jgi:hypothetical protein
MDNPLMRAIHKILMVSLLIMAGCTFNIHNQSQDQSKTLTASGEPIPAKVGLRRVAEQGQSPCGDTFQKFVEYLRKEHVFTELLYELRPTDTPDFVFDVQFNCEVDQHPIQNNVIGALEGPLAFTPLPLHSLDWVINASVVVYRSDQIVKRYDVMSHFAANVSYWGLFQRSKYREAFQNADDYTYQQLVSHLREDRTFFGEHAANQSP